MNATVHHLLSHLAVYLCEKTGTYPTPPKAKRSKKSYTNRGPNIPGIVGDAQTLGVSHPHLQQVLTGKRKSESLTRRYAELQARKARAAKA